MPSPLKSKSAREFCATCGWPAAADGRRCEACGGDSVPAALEDGSRRPALREPPSGDDSARQAFDAWRARDYARLIGLSLVAEGGQSPKTVSLGDGPAWSFFLRGTPVFVAVQSAAGTLTIEAPLARLPQQQRVAAMRVALELCDQALLVSRICLRGDVLVLRFVGRLASLTPPMLRQALRDVASRAERHAEMLEASFDARPAVPEDSRAGLSWDVLGRSRILPRLAPPASRSMPPPPMPALGDDAPESGLEAIPAILAPQLAAVVLPPVPIPRPTPMPGPGAQPRGGTLTDLHVEAPAGRRPTMPPPPPTTEGATPADRFCDLLRHAQALATALSYDEKPATMLLLVRAAVYRAVLEFGEAVPDAVAYFYRSTQGSLKELWQSTTGSGGRRRTSAQIPIAEPALLIMQQIVAQRAIVPKHKAPTIEPLTNAADARAHLGRFVEEIERAPAELQLRHFLALGALAELLVRTKLPSSTDQRLREIMAHAHRDPSRTSSLELMMKALNRIATP